MAMPMSEGEHFEHYDFRMAMTLLSVDPPVVMTSTTNVHLLGDRNASTLGMLDRLFAESRVRPYILIQPSWHLDDVVKDDERVLAILRQTEDEFGRGHVILLSNEPADRVLAHKLGFTWEDVNQNSFVDEVTFRPENYGSRPFDAIYNAKMLPFKRHALAGGVTSLALLYARPGEEGARYLAGIRADLTSAVFLNHGSDGDYRPFEPAQVNAALNRARVGLALSDKEGAMYASMEHLLSGLPVVSTQNVGGRDEFADPEFWMTVPPDRDAVAGAVQRLMSLRLDPDHIRSATMDRIGLHRRRFVDLMRKIEAQNGRRPSWNSDWNFLRRFHGGLKHQSFRELRDEFVQRRERSL